VHRLKQGLTTDCVPVFTSDGLRQYYYAVTTHFGQWIEQNGRRQPVWQALPGLLYGQFRMVRVGRKLKQVYTKMLYGEPPSAHVFPLRQPNGSRDAYHPDWAYPS
jgi:hypothetical protein